MADQAANGMGGRGGISFVPNNQGSWEEDIWKAFEIDGGLSRYAAATL